MRKLLFRFVKKLVTELAGQVKKVKIEDYVYDETEAGGEAGNQKDNDEDEVRWYLDCLDAKAQLHF